MAGVPTKPRSATKDSYTDSAVLILAVARSGDRPQQLSQETPITFGAVYLESQIYTICAEQTLVARFGFNKWGDNPQVHLEINRLIYKVRGVTRT